MKANNVRIDCVVYAPGELEYNPAGGCNCTVTATFPTGGQVTRETGVFSSEDFARGAAANIKASLERMEVADERDAKRQVIIGELGY